MNNEEIRAILDRYWEATVALDLEKVHEFYHDDIVVEFPQSGERIRTTYTNSGNITLPKLAIRSYEHAEKQISG